MIVQVLNNMTKRSVSTIGTSNECSNLDDINVDFQSFYFLGRLQQHNLPVSSYVCLLSFRTNLSLENITNTTDP